MATRAVAHTIPFVLWDTANNVGKTGDGANVTLRWIKDGTSSALTSATVTEIDSTNAPGVYKASIDATESDCNIGVLAGKSSTSAVSLIPVQIQFERLPNAAAGATGGVMLNTTFTEPAAVPAWATATAMQWLAWIGALARNKVTETATTQTLRNDADSANIATSTVSDDGSQFTRGEWS